MSDVEIRLECLRLATLIAAKTDTLAKADEIYRFVRRGERDEESGGPDDADRIVTRIVRDSDSARPA